MKLSVALFLRWTREYIKISWVETKTFSHKVHRRTGNRSCSHSTTYHRCCCFLLMLYLCSSMESVSGRQSFTDFSNLKPSHRLEFSTNFSIMGPFHGRQSFMNGLLQCGSPLRSQVLPENLLQHDALLTGPQVLLEACSNQVLSMS